GATLNIVGDTALVGENYTIIENNDSGAVVGTFDGLPEGATIVQGGIVFSISYVGGDGNDVVLSANSVAMTWDGGGDGVNWSDAANWFGDVLPGAADHVFLDVAGIPTIVSSGNVSILSLTSNETISITGGVFAPTGNVSAPTLSVDGGDYIASHTLTGELQLNSGVIQVTGDTVINDPVVDVANATMRHQGGAAATLDNDFVIASNLNFILNNQISLGGVLSGPGGVSVSGGGSKVVFSGLNTYDGPTTITQAALELTGSGTLGSLASGTTVNPAFGDSAGLSLGESVDNAEELTLMGFGPILDSRASGQAIQSGNVILAATDSAKLTGFGLKIDGQVSGSISGTGTLIVETLSSMNFRPTVDNTFDATVHITKGTLGTWWTSNVVAIPGDIVVGTGTSTLSYLSVLGANTLAPTANITLNSDGFLDLDTHQVGQAFAVNQTINDLTVTGTALSPPSQVASQIDTTSTQSGQTGTLTIAGTYTHLGSAQMTVITGQLALTGSASPNLMIADGAASPDVQLAVGSSIVDGGVGNPTSVKKAGAGQLGIAGLITAPAAHTVSDGTLQLDGALAAISGPLTISGFGKLSGTGTVDDLTATSGGKISPGNSPGVINTGDFNLAASSTLEIELGGIGGLGNAGMTYDQVNVMGTVNLAGVLDLSLIDNVTATNVYTIINNDG
ncbi:MAG: hypothetical protein WBD31_07415, partial [Rubripirellula sp.]